MFSPIVSKAIDWNAITQPDAEGATVSNPFMPGTPATVQSIAASNVGPQAPSGIVTLPGAQTTVANPVVQQALTTPTPFQPLKGQALIESWMTAPQQDTYDLSGFTKLTPAKIETAQSKAEQILGRPLTDAELYKVGQGYTGSNLTNTIKLLAETQAAAPIYQNLYGTGPTAEQLYQATKDFNYKNINTKLDQALREGATGDQLLNIAKYDLGKGADATQYINQFLTGNDDYINEYESLKKYGIDPSLAGEGYFSQDKINAAYNDFTNTNLQTVFGDQNVPSDLKTYVADQLSTGKMTSSQALDYIQNSTQNVNQEATRIRNGLVNVLGFSTQDANNIYKALQGDAGAAASVDPAKLSLAKGWFNAGLKDNTSVYDEMLTYAAAQPGAENSKFFQNNPELYFQYVPLVGKETTYEIYNPLYGKKYTDEQLATKAEQLGIPLDQVKNKFITKTGINPNATIGEYKNAPILDASVVDAVLDGRLSATGTSGVNSSRTKNIGSDLVRGASSSIRTGAALVGLDMVENIDYETGQKTTQVTGNIKKAAQQAGIDISGFKDTYKDVPVIDEMTGQPMVQMVKENGKWVEKPVTQKVLDQTKDEQIFDAINDKLSNYYMVTAINPDNPKNHSADNFTATYYQRVNGRLIPVQEPKTFKGYIKLPEQDSLIGGTVGDIISGVASIPGIAEITMLAMNAAVPGSGTAAYPWLKGAQAAQLSGDIGEGIKAGAISALATQGGKYISPQISEAFGGNQFATQAATNAAISSGIAALQGGDVGNAALTGAITGGVGYGINTLLPSQGIEIAKELGLSPENQRLFANTLVRLAPTILTGGKIDATRLAMSTLISKSLQEMGKKT